jgi:pimeloyl-ACP methyl ester carboxylesterase
MAHFILVHGGFHGAWCWELLEPELERAGHTSVAMDLPIDRTQTWIDDYADAVVQSVAGQDVEGAYLVGHSLGGIIVPRVAAKLPGTRIIFLCAGFAHTTEQDLAESMEATAADFMSWLVFDELGRASMSRERAIAGFYHDVPLQTADWAVSSLRPHWAEGLGKADPIPPYADRVAHAVCTLDDAIINPERHRAMAERRFGITPVTLPGSHSPFLSRPAELAQVLGEIAVADQQGRRYVQPN